MTYAIANESTEGTIETFHQVVALLPEEEPEGLLARFVGQSERGVAVISRVFRHGRQRGLWGRHLRRRRRPQVRKIMDADPGVQAGVFVYELHPCRSFPGDALL